MLNKQPDFQKHFSQKFYCKKNHFNNISIIYNCLN